MLFICLLMAMVHKLGVFFFSQSGKKKKKSCSHFKCTTQNLVDPGPCPYSMRDGSVRMAFPGLGVKSRRKKSTGCTLTLLHPPHASQCCRLAFPLIIHSCLCACTNGPPINAVAILLALFFLLNPHVSPSPQMRIEKRLQDKAALGIHDDSALFKWVKDRWGSHPFISLRLTFGLLSQ